VSYAHDVFLSYAHCFEDWIEECFVPELTQYLSQELHPHASIFVDRTGIHTGDAWAARLKKELTQSRCIIAIWSPRYFHSEWCRYESSVMLYRERELGYRTVNKPEGLVFPVRAFDGDHFPEYARNIQWFDCRDYVRRAEVFKSSQRYLEFQDRMIAWVPQIAAAIRNAPQWRSDWLTDNWLNAAMSFHPEAPPVEFSAPLLH
jgi:hypothetical protein